MGQEHTDRHSREVETSVLQEMDQAGSYTFDELVEQLPEYTWAEVFAAVNRLSLEGTLILRHSSLFQYVVEVGRSVQLSR